jgi:hypothetical protein
VLETLQQIFSMGKSPEEPPNANCISHYAAYKFKV